MRILFDQGVPWPLRRYLAAHEVFSVSYLGWSQLRNGVLLAHAAQAGFDLLVTADKNIPDQNNLNNLAIGVVVLWTNTWPILAPHAAAAAAEIENCRANEVRLLPPPAQ